MIDNIRQTMARMSAIRTTMTGQSNLPPPASPGSMENLLSQAMSKASASYAPARGLTPVAGTIRTGAPPGFEQFQNGRLPVALLSPIAGTTERMWGPAAGAFEYMRNEAAKAGVDLTVSNAYRPVEKQYELAEDLGLYSQGGTAAVPGTSEHGWGRAVDLDLNDDAVAWLRGNAWKFGFVETVPREPWHWEFQPAG